MCKHFFLDHDSDATSYFSIESTTKAQNSIFHAELLVIVDSENGRLGNVSVVN